MDPQRDTSNLENITVTRFEENLIKFDKKYGKLFRIITLSIPELGSHIDAIYSGLIGNIERKNLIHFIQGWVRKELDDYFDENNKRQVELITHAILKSLRCSKEAQIERILDVLSSNEKNNSVLADEAEDLINIIAELSESEAYIFTEIYKMNDDLKERQAVTSISTYIDITTEDIIQKMPAYKDTITFYLNRLVGKGLLQESEVVYRREGKPYWYTEMGWRLFNTFHREHIT